MNIFKNNVLCICILLILFTVEIFGDKIWETSIYIPKKTIFEEEPVLVEIYKKNVSQKTQNVGRKAIRIEILKEGNKRESYYLYIGLSTIDSGIYLRRIKPGETYIKSLWIIIGAKPKENLRDPYKWEFLLDSAGKYSISFPEYSKEKVNIIIEEPVGEENIEAQKLFNISSEKTFIGDNIAEGNKNILDIYQKYPQSYLAPYAAYQLAQKLKGLRNIKERDFKQYSEYLNHIINRKPTHYLCEQSYYLLARGYFNSQFDIEETPLKLGGILKRIKNDYPKSKYIPTIEKYVRKLARKPKIAKTNNPQIDIIGADKIQEDVRNVFISFKKKLAYQKIDESYKKLRDDYIGIFMDYNSWKKQWRRFYELHNLNLTRLGIEKVEIAKSYTRPSWDKGNEKTWLGELVIITTKETKYVTNIQRGKEERGRPRKYITVLIKDDNKWLIISEYTTPPKNYIATRLLMELTKNLKKTFQEVKLFDGQNKILVWTEIQKRINIFDLNIEISWEEKNIVMEGDDGDEPILKGNLKVTFKKDEKTFTSTYEVTIWMKLSEDKLQMTKLDVKLIDNK